MDEAEFDTVTKAKEQGAFGSILSSYNLLENDKYMRAFGIDLEFAESHRDVNALFSELQNEDVPMLPNEIRELITVQQNSEYYDSEQEQ